MDFAQLAQKRDPREGILDYEKQNSATHNINFQLKCDELDCVPEAHSEK